MFTTRLKVGHMSKMITFDDVPAEVWEVWAIEQGSKAIGGVGLETWNYCNEIIKKYPDWFPWEHKYDQIPQPVHDAYNAEAHPPISFDLKPGYREDFVGMLPMILAGVDHSGKLAEPTLTMKEMFKSIFENQRKEEDRKRAEYLERKKIWDKHYSKYGLEYRE